MSALAAEILRRRTFAMISHPDAGKTTLTEKLLLFGGAIQLAGEVKARGDRQRARTDWMAVERERGISVSAAVMSFEHHGLAFNNVGHAGPPGFQRGHLPNIDRDRQRGDGARRRPQWRQGGIEDQTRKLFEVCRLRDVPILTSRESRDPFDLRDEVEESPGLDLTPASWSDCWRSSSL
jgi:peptide chain release factor 3